jgi:periplasmic protein TonB
MFREALLESSPLTRRRRHWPMATAFTAQLAVAGALVLLPLVSTGVISLRATRLSLPTPPTFIPLANKPVDLPSGRRGAVTLARAPEVVSLVDSRPLLAGPFFHRITTASPEPSPNLKPFGGDPSGPDLPIRGTTVVPPRIQRIIISNPSEAMLLKKVVPEYPQIARITGVQGDVKLHAIIAKDGTIQSLTVTGGHPMLVEAAKQAVQQWRYRPYMLNGEPIEVETVITVTFTRF